ncbi:MAG: dihydroorotase [Parcubacteria group bacterium]|nr:dihydroorotase [Parcubacteria group bacterium]
MLKELPLVIDPHVHFRVPGGEHKEDWITASRAALAGGVGLVFDMPNTSPSTDSQERLTEKKQLIDKQIAESGYPLQYKLYFGATADNCEEIKKLQPTEVAGVKLFMGSSTGDLLVDKDEDIAKVFQAAKEADLVVAIHAEDEEMIKEAAGRFKDENKFSVHSQVRNKEAAAKAVERAINLSREVGNRLYICHVSSKLELDLIREAKKEGLPVYAEVCTHHLFFTTADYERLKGKVRMNPPVRDQEDIDALWQGISDGIVDTLGTDHAPHTLEEKNQNVWNTPSGVPGIETLLPLMLNSVNQGKVSLEKLADLMHNNVVKIFGLEPPSGKTIVDMDLAKEVRDEDLQTKCGWSPYAGMKLKGWPVKVELDGKEYNCE